MATFQRIWMLIKSNVNALIGGAEDPKKLIEQSLLDMQQQLAKTKERVTAAVADEKKLRGELDRERKLGADWENRAMLALKEGREDLATQALQRQAEHNQNAEQLHKAWVQHQNDTTALKAGLRSLYDRVEELKRRKNVLIARQTRAEAHREISDTMSSMKDQSAIAVFERMEEQIADMERQASAAAEMAEELKGNNLEADFKALEQRQAADARLLALKQKMGLAPGAPARPKQLGASAGAAVEDAVLNDDSRSRG